VKYNHVTQLKGIRYAVNIPETAPLLAPSLVDIRFSENSVSACQSTRRYNPQQHQRRLHSRNNLKYLPTLFFISHFSPQIPPAPQVKTAGDCARANV
jgi:hypothetical protein